MLGYVSENFPRTGALGLAIMGGAGMLSASFVLPLIGRFFDAGIASRLPTGQTAETLSGATPGSELASTWANIQSAAGHEALGKVAALPAVLAVVFILLLVTRKKPPAVPTA